jgi:hypothetical protein
MGTRFGRAALFTGSIGLIISLIVSAGSAYAATDGSSSITTSPVSADLNIQPGQSESTNLQVMNNGSKPLPISIELKLFTAHGSTGQAAIVNPNPNDPELSWVHFSQSTFTAQPGVWTSVKMTVSLPLSANLGYYYAVLFKPNLPTTSSSKTATVTLSNAILVLVDTGTSNELRQATVSAFSASKKVYEYLPASFAVTVHNSGNIFIAPEGSIYISKSASTIDPSTINSLNLNQGGGHVLPGSNRVFTATWSNGFPDFVPEKIAGQPVLKKNGQPIERLHWDLSNIDQFRFGRYYAHLALVYSNGQRDIPIYGTVSFWVIPWKLLLIGLLVILIPIALFIMALRYRHMYRKHRSSSSKEKKDKEV